MGHEHGVHQITRRIQSRILTWLIACIVAVPLCFVLIWLTHALDMKALDICLFTLLLALAGYLVWRIELCVHLLKQLQQNRDGKG